MTPVDDLVAWLTQILDEEQALAEAAVKEEGAEWSPGDQYNSDSVSSVAGGYVATGAWGYMAWETRQHIARHDPIRTLADIAAKRAIIALHTDVEMHIEFIHERSGDHWCDVCGSVDDAPVAWPCDTLRLLASAYADRPGYQDEWRP